MTIHHERVRAVLLVHALESGCRFDSGARGDANVDNVVDLTARVTRVQAEIAAGGCADAWLLAAYDAALAELCRALGLGHSLIDENVCPERERQRVELELLSSVLPLE